MSTTLQQALKLHQSGQLGEAERLYHRLLRIDPHHADARHLLGVVAHQQGDHTRAVEQILQAVSLRPRNATYLGNLGSAYRALGRLEDAAEVCQQAVDIAPNMAMAHFNLGLVLLKLENLLGARRRFEQAVTFQPDLVEAWANLGNVCEWLQDPQGALSAYQQVVRLQPDRAEAHYNLANVQMALGQLVPAIESYSRALGLQPNFPDALNNLGTALRSLGRPEEAIRCFQLALQLQPDFSEASNNLGAAWQSLGRQDEAIAAFDQALKLDPDNGAAHNNRGTVFNVQGKYDLAETCFLRAVQLNGHDAAALGNLAVAQQSQGRVLDADQTYTQALRLKADPRLQIQQALMLPPVYESVADVQHWRSRFVDNLTRLKADGITLNPATDLLPVNFYLAYQGFDDCELQRSVAELYCAPDHGVPVSSAPAVAVKPRPATGRRRVGFLSKYFCSHTIGHLTQGLIADLPRTEFEVVVLSLGQPQDALAKLIERSADRYVVLPDHVAAARDTIARLQLDVLFYPDLGMDPLSWTLAHSRLAPVQCVTWGHPVTTGIPTVDYFISSGLIDDRDADYTERLVRLSTLPAYYHRPLLPAVTKPRSAFGLPTDSHLYLCPQSLFKFHPDFDPLLREILERDPQGRVVLIEAPQPHWTETLQRRFEQTLGPAASRVQFLPRQSHDDFLNLMAVSDVMLDPLHFGGGNTTYQGLAMGIPIVTLPSQFMRGRVTDGCYRKLGLTDAVAKTPAEYVEISLRFAGDHQFREQFRRRLQERSAALYEDRQAVRELAEFFRTAK